MASLTNRIFIASVIISLVVGVGMGYALSSGEISGLQSEVMSLESEVSTLTTDYNDLNATYDQLLNDYDSLISTSDELQRAYDDLEEAYDLLNSAGLVFDRLRISDLKVSGEYWYSSVVGNVTNMGNETMNKVYVVLFKYEPDGSLYSYSVTTIENLAVDETNDFSLSLTLEEGQKFRVLAVGSYGTSDIESGEVVNLLAEIEELEARIAELEQMVEYEVYVLKDEEYYYSIKSDLENANETVLVAMYSMVYDSDDPFDWANDLIKELVNAKERGVNVTVIIEYRTYFGYMDGNLEAYEYLSENGVTVHLDNEDDTDHMKLVIIGDRIAYVGSHNWSESSLYYNHETSVKIVSEDIVKVFKAYFETL